MNLKKNKLKNNAGPLDSSEKTHNTKSPNVIDGICSHLEYLGYKVTKTEDVVTAEGAGIPHIVNIYEKLAGILFTSSYSTSENSKNNRLSYLEWVNVINRKSDLVTALAGEHDALTFAGWFPKIYDKQLFGGFFNIFCNDINKALYGKDAKTEEFLK
jgi:hypothetical protein